MLRISLLFSAILTFCPAKSSLTWAHTESDLPVDPQAHFGELSNGFRYLLYKNAEPPGRVSLRLHVDAGSLCEADDQRGMAHFLEHMLFEGSKNYTAAELIPEMQRLGIAFGAHANAYTSFDETVYMLDLPNLQEKTLTLGFTVMRDFCDGALLEEKEVEAERGVILSEKNSRDSVDFRLMKQQFRYLLPDHLVSSRFPIGIEETIKNCPQARIKDLYTQYYDPRLMTFVVVGDIDIPTFEKRIQEVFSSMEAPAMLGKAPELGSITEPEELKTALFTDPEVNEEDVSLIRCFKNKSLPDTSQTRAQQLPLKIANAIITRRFEKIAQEENSPINAGTAYDNVWFDEVFFGALSVTPSEGKWKESVRVLEQEFRRALQFGFTDAEYKEVTAKLIKDAEVAVEAASSRQSSGVAMEVIRSINDRECFTTPQTDLETLQKILTTLSIEQCHDAYKNFWEVPGYHLILTTTEDSGNDADTLEELFLKSQESEVTRPEDSGTLSFSYDQFGNTAEITQDAHIENLDIHQLTLSNGVKVNLKKTDFEKGKVYVQARLSGGLAVAEEKGLASFTQAVFTAGGLGKHSADELKQIFSGNALSLDFTIDEDSFFFTGLTNQEDLSLQLRLLCAYLTDPGYRDEALRLYKKSLPDTYDELSQTLEGAFQYLNAFAHGEDDRFSIPTQEEAAGLALAQAQEWMQQYLTGAVELTIIGDLDEEKTRKDLLSTIGTLPARAPSKKTEIKQLSLPSLPQEKDLTYTSELDRAAAIVAWRTIGVTDDISEHRRLNVLASILTNRMREEIREKLGSSYSPYASARASETFSNYGHVTALSICKTEDIKKINDLLLKLGTSLATDGATQDELDRALNPVLEQIDSSLRQNSYWLSTVMNRSQAEPKRLDWARTRETDYSSISLQDINALAKKYLIQENALVYSLFPQKKE